MFIWANKSHTKTPEQHTHMHIQNMHTDFTHTHTYTLAHITHTSYIIFTTITTGIYMRVVLLAVGTPALSPHLNGSSVQQGVQVHGFARSMRDKRGGVHS